MVMRASTQIPRPAMTPVASDELRRPPRRGSARGFTFVDTLIATLLLCFGMLFSSLVFGNEDSGCPENMSGLQRMIGPAAWYAFDECVLPAPAVAR